jgi:hypothetical protein
MDSSDLARIFGVVEAFVPSFLDAFEGGEGMSDKVLYTIQCKKEGGKRWLSGHCWLPRQKPTPSFAVAQKAFDEASRRFPKAEYRIREVK